MGKEFNFYYERLKQLMSGQPPKSLDEAMAALKAERQAAVPEAPRSEEEHKRLDFSLKCGDQIMDRAAEKIKKEAAWDAAVKQVSKYASNPSLTIPKGAGDWLVSMMKTGDTWQDRAYNEILAAQMGLCTGKLTVQEALGAYEEQRLQFQFRADDIPDILYNAPRKILQGLEEKIEQGQQELTRLDGSADAILGGEADDDAVESSYRTLESDAIDLLLNAKGALEDIRGFEKTLPEKYPGKLPPEELDKRERAWQAPDKKRIDSVRERAEQVANLIYALQNQQARNKIHEEQNEIREEQNQIHEEQVEAPAEEKKAPVRLTPGQKTVLKNQRLDEFLEPYGLTWEDKDRKSTEADRIVYRKDTGETVILKVTEVDAADGYKVEISDAAPGHIVNFDLAQRIGDVKGKVKLLETREDHTVEYNKVVETWAALMEAELDNEPSLNQVKDVGNRFHLFGQALEKYIKMRGNKPEPDQKQSWYMQTIKELRSLVSDKLDAIELVDNHIRTKNELELDGKELEAAIDAARTKPTRKARSLGLPDTYIETAMRWSEEISGMIDQYDKQMENAWDAAIRRAQNEGLEKVTPPESIPLPLFQVVELADNLNTKADKFQLKILLGAPYYDPIPADGAARAQENGSPKRTLYDAALEGKLGPRELADTLAKNALACEVAKELVKVESQIIEKGDRPIQSLISGGRIYDVVDMVKNSQSFGEHYRFLDLSVGAKDQLDVIRNAGPDADPPAPAKVAKEIMKSYLDRQRQAQAARNAQQPAEHAPVDMRIKGPQPPVLK